MKNGEIERAREIYKRSAEKLANDEEVELLYIAFAKFEEQCKEIERERCIYKFSIDRVPKLRAEDLYRKFGEFERQYVDKEGIEDDKVAKRRFQYEELEAGDFERTRDGYKEFLKLIPHEKFSFAKIWLPTTNFEIRQLNLQGALEILGNAIGKGYVEASAMEAIFRELCDVNLVQSKLPKKLKKRRQIVSEECIDSSFPEETQTAY